MAMPDPNRVIALEAEKIRTNLEKLVGLLASEQIGPELRMAKAQERIADALDRPQAEELGHLADVVGILARRMALLEEEDNPYPPTSAISKVLQEQVEATGSEIVRRVRDEVVRP